MASDRRQNSQPFNPLVAKSAQFVVDADTLRSVLGLAPLPPGHIEPTPKNNTNRCADCLARGWKKCHHRYIKCNICQKSFKPHICFVGDKEHCGRGGTHTHTHIKCECDVADEVIFDGKVEFKTYSDKMKSTSR